MHKEHLRYRDYYRDFACIQRKAARRTDSFSLLRLLQICAALLLLTVAGMSQANAQGVTVTASSPNTTPGSGSVTYSASATITNPSLNSEQQITNVTYTWSSSDTCNPTTGSSTTVTAIRHNPGTSTSSVSCSVTWYIYNTSTKQTTTEGAGGSASVNFDLGVMWSPGTITGGVMTSPQNQTSSPYTPTTVGAVIGGQLTGTIGSASASDAWTFSYPSGGNTVTSSGTGSDTVSYAWSGGVGTLSSTSSASTTWTAPSTPQTATLSCTISATAPAVVAPDGGSRGPSAVTASVSIAVIGGPVSGDTSDVRWYGDGSAPAVSLSADSSEPSGVTYQWSASGPISIQGSQTSSTVSVMPTAGSTSANDATVTVTYTAGNASTQASQSFTIRTPSTTVQASTDSSEYQAFYYPGGANYSNIVGFSGYNVQWKLLDQFGAGIDVPTVAENADTVTQDPTNNSVYSGGTWNPFVGDTWSTNTAGMYDHPDPYASTGNGRSTATNDNSIPPDNMLPDWQSLTAPSSRAIGHFYHNYVAMGVNTTPFMLNTYTSTGASFY